MRREIFICFCKIWEFWDCRQVGLQIGGNYRGVDYREGSLYMAKLNISALMLLLIIVLSEFQMFMFQFQINKQWQAKHNDKVHLFGIQDKATREYVLDEDGSKGSNGTISMIFDGIKKLNNGERHLTITCDNDNAGGQNKNNNNTTIWFYR